MLVSTRVVVAHADSITQPDRREKVPIGKPRYRTVTGPAGGRGGPMDDNLPVHQGQRTRITSESPVTGSRARVSHQRPQNEPHFQSRSMSVP